MESVSDSRSGIESVSEAGGVTRRGLFRRAERGMVSIVLKVFRRSWKDAARVQNAEWVSFVRSGRGGGWGVSRDVPSVSETVISSVVACECGGDRVAVRWFCRGRSSDEKSTVGRSWL